MVAGFGKGKKEGFGGGRAKKPNEISSKPTSGEGLIRTAQKKYDSLKKKEGMVVAQVHARAKDTEQWYAIAMVRVRLRWWLWGAGWS